jgi:membrane-associated protein
MSSIMSFIGIFLHLDKYLSVYMNEYGMLIYLILFAIIFCETALVFTPFLPGDSLIFATGALAAAGSIKFAPIFIIFCIAAITGDTVNYSIGQFLKDKVIAHANIRFIKREYLEHSEAFFKKHGGITIILARFIPIIRTFAPFTAGVSAMPYRRFILFNVAGGISWVSLALFGGYIFGNIPFVKNNFSMVILAIIVVSLLPVVITWGKNQFGSKEAISMSKS